MAALPTISAALKLVDSKKENLRKAFEALQAHSSSLPSFTLSWSDLDSYFTSIHSSLERKFLLLQSEETRSPLPNQIQITPSANPSSSQAWPELKSYCEKMDGLGLRSYIVAHQRRGSIRAELPAALRCAPDAAAMVLDAMEGFYRPQMTGDKDPELQVMRRVCIILFEELMQTKPEIKPEIRVRAMNLAQEWKGKVNVDVEDPLAPFGFLNLLASYGLMDEFNVEELIDFAVAIARIRQASELYRVLGFRDRISDIIQILIKKGEYLSAVKFIFDYELSSKFPPVPLLRDHVKQSKKLTLEVQGDGESSLMLRNEAIAKEISGLKSVVKCIEDHGLESEYPKASLLNSIEKLEKKMSTKKRPRKQQKQ